MLIIKYNRFLVWVLFFLSLALGACSGVEGQNGSSLRTAPDFTLATLDGGRVELGNILKTKNAVLVFWTTWCPACRNEIPEVERYYKKNGGSVAVIGINIQESKAKVRQFVEKQGVSYPVVLDELGSVSDAYGIRGIPTVVAVDKEKKILYYGHNIIEMEKKVDFK